MKKNEKELIKGLEDSVKETTDETIDHSPMDISIELVSYLFSGRDDEKPTDDDFKVLTLLGVLVRRASMAEDKLRILLKNATNENK